MRRPTIPFYCDPHVWNAVIAAVAPVLINHIPDPWWRELAIELYGALVAAGIISARQSTRTRLGLQKDK